MSKRYRTTNYNTKKENKTIVAQLLLIVLMLGLIVCMFLACGWLSAPAWKPDVIYPMTNQQIEWNYPGRK